MEARRPESCMLRMAEVDSKKKSSDCFERRSPADDEMECLIDVADAVVVMEWSVDTKKESWAGSYKVVQWVGKILYLPPAMVQPTEATVRYLRELCRSR